MAEPSSTNCPKTFFAKTLQVNNKTKVYLVALICQGNNKGIKEIMAAIAEVITSSHSEQRS